MDTLFCAFIPLGRYGLLLRQLGPNYLHKPRQMLPQNNIILYSSRLSRFEQDEQITYLYNIQVTVVFQIHILYTQ